MRLYPVEPLPLVEDAPVDRDVYPAVPALLSVDCESASYSFRTSLSESTVYASLISLNFASWPFATSG